MSDFTARSSPRILSAAIGVTAVVAIAAFGGVSAASAADPGDDDFLGTAESFVIVATTTVTDAGLDSNVYGDVGLTSVAPGAMQLEEDQNVVNGQVINGTIYVDTPTPDPVAMEAVADVLVAYNGLSAVTSTETVGTTDLALIIAHQVGTEVVYLPGVYDSDSTLLLDGEIILDGQNDENSVFIFRAGSSLTAGTGASILLSNGAQACNVYWRILEDATIETGVDFVGTVIAGSDIWVRTGAVIDGQLLAGALGAGEVTLDHNTINGQTSCVRSTTSAGVTTTTTRVNGTTTTSTTSTSPTTSTAGVGGVTQLAATGVEPGFLPIGGALLALLVGGVLGVVSRVRGSRESRRG